MNKKTDETEQKKMKKALESYRKDTNSAKSYLTSMKEISSWLATKGK